MIKNSQLTFQNTFDIISPLIPNNVFNFKNYTNIPIVINFKIPINCPNIIFNLNSYYSKILIKGEICVLKKLRLNWYFIINLSF